MKPKTSLDHLPHRTVARMWCAAVCGERAEKKKRGQKKEERRKERKHTQRLQVAVNSPRLIVLFLFCMVLFFSPNDDHVDGYTSCKLDVKSVQPVSFDSQLRSAFQKKFLVPLVFFFFE